MLQLCPKEPSFTWCANRKYLSGGSAKMVYTEFVVETHDRFGEYNACNPNNKTGIFQVRRATAYFVCVWLYSCACVCANVWCTFITHLNLVRYSHAQCETRTSGNIPHQCATGFEIFHEDCLNGTELRNFLTASTLYEAEASCCAACSDAKNCGGW